MPSRLGTEVRTSGHAIAPEVRRRIAGGETTGNTPSTRRAPAGAQDSCAVPAPLRGASIFGAFLSGGVALHDHRLYAIAPRDRSTHIRARHRAGGASANSRW